MPTICIWPSLSNDLQCNPGNNHEEKRQEFVQAEKGVNRHADVVFWDTEHPAVDLQDHWPQHGHKCEADNHQAKIDDHAPEEELLRGVYSHIIL